MYYIAYINLILLNLLTYVTIINKYLLTHYISTWLKIKCEYYGWLKANHRLVWSSSAFRWTKKYRKKTQFSKLTVFCCTSFPKKYKMAMEQQFLFCTHTCFVCKPDILGSPNWAILFSEKNIATLIIITAKFCKYIRWSKLSYELQHLCNKHLYSLPIL